MSFLTTNALGVVLGLIYNSYNIYIYNLRTCADTTYMYRTLTIVAGHRLPVDIILPFPRYTVPAHNGVPSTVVVTTVHRFYDTVCTVLSHLSIPFTVSRATVHRSSGYRYRATVRRSPFYRLSFTVLPFVVHRSVILPITPLSSFAYVNEEPSSLETA
jgi:hypothetical protein